MGGRCFERAPRLDWIQTHWHGTARTHGQFGALRAEGAVRQSAEVAQTSFRTDCTDTTGASLKMVVPFLTRFCTLTHLFGARPCGGPPVYFT